jgi:hypothetical protein
VKHKQAVKSAKAGLALLDGASEGLGKLCKTKKFKEAEAKAKEAEGATEVPKDPLVGNSNFWFRFLGPPSEAKFQFCF